MRENLAEIEAMPHLCKKICLMWGTAEMDAHINTLVMDSRDGARKGLPVEVGAELLWLVKVNQWRRAIDYQERLKMSLPDARAKVQREDDQAQSEDIWSADRPESPTFGRRYSDKSNKERPHRRNEENTLFGIVFGAVTSKYTLFLIILILTIKAAWPTIKHFI